MSLLSKLRLITVDVTGTLIAYKGQLGDYYCMAAKSAGMPCPDYKRMHEGFKVAYTEMTRKYPCFGHASNMPNLDWWKMCVKDSFIRAGYDYDDETFEKVFRRIYATFGSSAPYSVFPDAQHFLRWLRSKGFVVGIVSNAEYRYKDVVLPALGLNQSGISGCSRASSAWRNLTGGSTRWLWRWRGTWRLRRRSTSATACARTTRRRWASGCTRCCLTGSGRRTPRAGGGPARWCSRTSSPHRSGSPGFPIPWRNHQ